MNDQDCCNSGQFLQVITNVSKEGGQAMLWVHRLSHRCPDNSWDQTHMQTTGQCGIPGLQSSLSALLCIHTAIFKCVGTTLTSFSSFLGGGRGDTTGHMHHFIQGAKGFTESLKARVPACPILFKILRSPPYSVAEECGLLCIWPVCQSKTVKVHHRGSESSQMWNAV